MKIAIGIAHHKEGHYFKEYPYIPIQVGAAINLKELGIQKDSEGDNISLMNAYCSELSATYWLWKNCTADFKGLFHYRRFMTYQKKSYLKHIPRLCLYFLSKCTAPFIRDSRCFVPNYSIIHIDEKESDNYLRQFAKDIEIDICKNKTQCFSLGYMKHSTRTMRTHLNLGIGGKHFEILEPIIQKEFPEFSYYFQKSMRSGKLIGYNLIIAQNEIFDRYCEIMFGILNKYHSYFIEDLKEGEIDRALLRDSGYVGELITDAFIRMIRDKHIKCKQMNCAIVNIEATGLSYTDIPLLQRIKKMIRG